MRDRLTVAKISAMSTLIASLALTLSAIIACAPTHDGDDATDTSTPPSGTVSNITGDNATGETSADTTGNIAATTGEDMTSTGDIATTTSGGGNGGGTNLCINTDPKYECQAVDPNTGFCGYISSACTEHDLGDVYCNIVNNMCRRGDDACDICFYLSNTCEQVGVDCDDLYYGCGCVVDALDIL